MKTEYQKKVENLAYKLIYSNQNTLLNRVQKLDNRYNLNKEILLFIKNNQITSEQKKAINLKRKQRAQNRPAKFTNILNNKLFVDYKANKFYLTKVNDNWLNFNGRFHYAKNSTDLFVIQLIKKTELEKRQ